jgi:serine/threonine protein kinase
MVAELSVGEEFAGHRIERLLGRGGMGVVYLATHLRLARKVAIKLLNPDLASDDFFRRRFLRESQAAAALEHPNIVPVYDAGESEGRAYISMRFVDGTDLAALLKSEGRLPPNACIATLAQIASALDAAHGHGLIHRDVKPANILLERLPAGDAHRRAFLSDFGITKRLSGEQTTETGRFIGTIDYTAPEQITGGPLRPGTDQYSLACVLFQSLTGAVPFPRHNELAVMYAHLEEPPPPVDGRFGLGPEVDAVFLRAMAKAPAQRFATCADFLASAADAVGVDPRTASSPPLRTSAMSASPSRTDVLDRPPGHRAPRRSRRPRWVLAVAAVLVVVAAGLATLLVGHHGSPRAAKTTGTQSPGPSPSGHRSPAPFPSGFTWRQAKQSQFARIGSQSINRAATGNHLVVAVGSEDPPGPDESDPAIWYSSDGLHWDRIINGMPGTQDMDAVVFDGKGFVAVGTENQQAADIWTSADGRTWNEVPAGRISGGTSIHKIISTPDGLVAVGWDAGSGDRDATVWQSSTGSYWVRETAHGSVFAGPPNTQQEMWAVTEFRGGLVAVGLDDRYGDWDAAIWRHDDQGWHDPVIIRKPEPQIIRAVVAGGPGLVAVGYDVSAGTRDAAIWTSADGVAWHEVRLPHEPGYQQLNGVVAFRHGVVAVGWDLRHRDADVIVWMSSDGVHWTRSTSPKLAGPGKETAHGAVVFDGRLIVVGDAGAGQDQDAAVWVGTPVDRPGTPSA